MSIEIPSFMQRTVQSLFLCFLLFLIPGMQSTLAQQCVKAVWAKSYGGNSYYNEIVDGKRKAAGNFVVLGSYGDVPLVLDTFLLASVSSLNYYLAEHDSSGMFLHARSIMSGSALMPAKMTVGNDGSSYITGYWEGTAVIGTDTLPPATRKRVFVAKFSPTFEYQWVTYSDWMSADCKAVDITHDTQNNVYITGNFEDDAFKIGSFIIYNRGGYNMWSDDAFVMKIDAAGAVQWLKGIGSDQDESGRTITADSLGNLYITAITQQSNSILYLSDNYGIPYGIGVNTMIITLFRCSDGYCEWARLVGGFNSYDKIFPWNAVLGENNSLYLCGEINGVVQLPPFSYYSSDNNGFVAKFNASGDCEWLKTIGGSNTYEAAYNLAFGNNRLAVSGRLYSNQPYVGDFPLYSTLAGGSFDAFNAQFYPDGTLSWARGNNSGSMSGYFNNCVLIDDDGNQLLWGSFLSAQSWYPLSLTNTSSNYKTFLVKFMPFSQAQAFTVSAGNDKTGLCGNTMQLNATTNPASIPFGWWPDLGFSANNTKNPNIQPSTPRDYIFYASYQGCVISDTVRGDLSNYGLSLQTLDSIPFCEGDSVQLFASCNDTAAVYNWTPPKYINSTNSPFPWVKPERSANYIVTATANACTATDTTFVIRHPKPWINLPKQDQYYSWWRYHLCQGSPVDIDLGDSSNIYTILTPQAVTFANNNLVTINADSIGSKILKIMAVDPYGCSNTDSVLIMVHGNQQPPVYLGSLYDRSACEGDSLQLNIWITNSIQYNFQYSWYAGWEIDSLNGNGWQEINSWDKNYEIFNYSSGYSTSTYYSRLRIKTVTADMDGFRFRSSIHDYCSPKSYSNFASIDVGPKITVHPLNKTLCQGVTDSIYVNSEYPNAVYLWEVKSNGVFVPVIPQAGVIEPNGKYLRLLNVQPSYDSIIFRCRVEGCNNNSSSYSMPAIIRVVTTPQILWQSGDDSLCEGSVDSLMVVVSPGPYIYNWYENNNPITYNTGQMCCYNSTKLKFNPVYLYQDNYSYKLRIRNSQCSIDIFSTPVLLTVNPAETVTWPGDTFFICQNPQPIFLNGGNPPGGTYSGPGVYGTIFNPMAASLGPNIITYTVAGSGSCGGTASRIFLVKEAPTATWEGGDTSVCKNEPPFLLTGGLPAGGYYSGTGVVNDMFYASQVYTLSSYITYHYVIANGCSDVKSKTFNIKFIPSVTYYGPDLLLCLDDNPVTLTGGYPAGGVYSGPGVVADTFHPGLSGIGTHNLLYTYTDPNGCHNSDHFLATVDACTGLVHYSVRQFTIAVNQNHIILHQSDHFNQPFAVDVYNFLGQKIHSATVDYDIQSIEIIVPRVMPGMYIIRCYNEQEDIVRKIILE